MEMKIERLPNYRTVYVRQIGPYGSNNVQAMEKLKDWVKNNHLLDEASILLGVIQDNPNTTPPESCRYDAAMVISDKFQVNHSIQEGEILGGEYAVFKVKHTSEDMQKAWSELFPILLNTYKLDDKSIFERYLGDMNANEYCEICVPVLPLKELSTE